MSLYDVAREVNHSMGLPWTDPRTGTTHPAPAKAKRHDLTKKDVAFSIRIPIPLRKEVASMARAKGVSSGEVTRLALQSYLSTRKRSAKKGKRN